MYYYAVMKRNQRTTGFCSPTDYLPDIIYAARSLLKKLYFSGFEYWRTTIYLFGIEPIIGRQMDFFESDNRKKLDLSGKIDEINSKYG